MATIPMYQQQASAQGLVQVDPSRAGGLPGQALEGLGRDLGQASQVIAGAMGQQNAREEQVQIQLEAERRARNMEEARLLAAAEIANAEREAVGVRRGYEKDQVNDDGSLRQVDTAPYGSFEEALAASHKEMVERVKKVNPDAARLIEAPLLTIRYNEDAKLSTFQEKRRDAYVVGKVQQGVDSDAKSIFEADDPQAAFDAISKSWDETFQHRQAGPGRIPLEVRDQLREDARRKHTMAAEQGDLDRQDGEGYLRSRGLDAEGKPLGSTRRMRGDVALLGQVGKWESEIQAAAAETGVDPALIAAVMEQESRGNDKALSPKGARGLMQLMPGTAAELGVDPDDPAQNIRGGAVYLARQMDRFGGDIDKALAAYNAGPGAVQRAGGVPNFPETKDYVAKIRSRYDSMSEEVPAAPVALPPSWAKMTPEEQVRWREQAVRDASQRRAEGAENLRTWFQNAEAMAKAGQVPTGAPTYAEAVKAYGPDRGYQMFQQGRALVKLGENMAGLADASDEEISRRLQGLAPDPSDQNTFAVRSATQQDLQRAAEAVQRERRKAPLQWALQSNPGVRKAYNAFAQAPNDPAARDAYVVAAQAAQRRYGIEQPEIITSTEAGQIVSSLTDPKRVEVVGMQVQELAQKWGPHWPAVYGQISKDLPPTIDVLASGVNHQTATTLARLLPVKTDDLRKAASGESKRTINEDLSSALDPFIRSMVATSPNAGREKALRFQGEAERLALHYVGQGMSASEAARKASDELVSSRYKFVEQTAVVRDPSGGGSVFRPVYRIPSDHDAADVERGAQRLRESISPTEVFPPLGMEPGAWAQEIASKGYWVTSPDESGLELHMAGDPVADRKGAPIRRTWTDLTASAGPGFWSRFREGFTGQGATNWAPFDPSMPRAPGSDASNVAPAPRRTYVGDRPAQGLPGVSLP
jgi:hypothetical protein